VREWEKDPLSRPARKTSEIQTLGGVQGHEGDASVRVKLGLCQRPGRRVEEVAQGLAANLGIVGGISQLLQVFNAAEGLRRAFGFQSFDVAGAVE